MAMDVFIETAARSPYSNPPAALDAAQTSSPADADRAKVADTVSGSNSPQPCARSCRGAACCAPGPHDVRRGPPSDCCGTALRCPSLTATQCHPHISIFQPPRLVTPCLSFPDRAAGGRLNRFNSRRSFDMTMGYWLQALSVLTFSALLCAVRAGGQGQPALNLMPVPADLQMGSGSLRMD